MEIYRRRMWRRIVFVSAQTVGLECLWCRTKPRGSAPSSILGSERMPRRASRASFPESFFDAIRLSHVLEHLTDPQGTLREISRILKPDGLVYVTVPNTRSLNFWLFGKEWYSLDTPRHVISYSLSALKFLCDATGFD